MNAYIIASIVIVAILLFYLSCYIAHILISKSVYGRRGDSSISIKYALPSDYTNLNVKKDYFLNNKNARLSVYEYVKKDTKPVGLVLMIHGIGGGHFYLLPLINYLCERGLMVLAYDQYASGTSEGRRIESMSQGAIDVKYAVKYVEEHYDLPFYVLGHSWGGYAAAQSLRYSKKILKCVDIAGFNNEAAMASKIAAPMLRLCSFLHFGKYVYYTTAGAFKKTSAKVLYLQGKQDAVVNPKKSGFRYEKMFKNKDNIQVMMLDNKGHTPFVDFESQMNQIEIMKQFGMLASNLVPLETYVDFNKNNIPDMDVYKIIGDFLLS